MTAPIYKADRDAADHADLPSESLTIEATDAAGAYLQILDPEQAMTPGEVDAFTVGVQAGITAAFDVAQRAGLGGVR